MRENRKHITRVSSDEARHLKDETEARLNPMYDAALRFAGLEHDHYFGTRRGNL